MRLPELSKTLQHVRVVEWVTIGPVAEAIKVLEHRSARAAAARCVDTLWPVLIVKAGSKDRISAEIVR
jgi:hypothetical protein